MEAKLTATILVAVTSSGNALAQPDLPVISTFDSGVDGWTLVNEATWLSEGGNAGGFLFGHNINLRESPRAIPPKVYLGNWSSLDGKAQLTYDHKVIDPGSPFCDPEIGEKLPYTVELIGPGGSAIWEGDFPPVEPSDWVTVRVPINEAAWRLTSGSWRALLEDVQDVFIYMELFCNTMTPDDSSGLDNIVLKSWLGDCDASGSTSSTLFASSSSFRQSTRPPTVTRMIC